MAGCGALSHPAIVSAPGDSNPANNSATASVPRRQVAPPAAIPTLSQWAMLLLGAFLALTAARTLRPRRR